MSTSFHVGDGEAITGVGTHVVTVEVMPAGSNQGLAQDEANSSWLQSFFFCKVPFVTQTGQKCLCFTNCIWFSPMPCHLAKQCSGKFKLLFTVTQQ